MNIYKIDFVVNKVHSCKRVDYFLSMDKDMILLQNEQEIICALVKADTEEEAKQRAKLLSTKFSGE